MKYFDKDGNEINESEVDFEKGYLVDRTTEIIPAVEEVSHIEEQDLGGGFTLRYKKIDVAGIPEHEEVVEQTYLLYTDEVQEPTIEDRVSALESAVEMLTEVLE